MHTLEAWVLTFGSSTLLRHTTILLTLVQQQKLQSGQSNQSTEAERLPVVQGEVVRREAAACPCRTQPMRRLESASTGGTAAIRRTALTSILVGAQTWRNPAGEKHLCSFWVSHRSLLQAL